MSSIARGSKLDTIVEQVAAVLPNHTNDLPSSWVSVDLGPNRRLIPSKFCILHGDVHGLNALRNWEMQGKNNETDPWVVLKKFKKNLKLHEDVHSTAAWGLTGKKGVLDVILHSNRCNWGGGSKLGFRYVHCTYTFYFLFYFFISYYFLLFVLFYFFVSVFIVAYYLVLFCFSLYIYVNF